MGAEELPACERAAQSGTEGDVGMEAYQRTCFAQRPSQGLQNATASHSSLLISAPQHAKRVCLHFTAPLPSRSAWPHAPGGEAPTSPVRAQPGLPEDSPALAAHLQSQMTEAAHLQVFLGVGLALLCFSLLLGCAVCWRQHRRLRPHTGREQVLEQTLVDLAPVLPSKTAVVPIQRQYKDITGEVLGAQAEESSPASPTHGTDVLPGRVSLPSLPLPQRLSRPSKLMGAWQRRCPISGANILCNEKSQLTRPSLGASIPQSYTAPGSLSSAGAKQQPQLHFDLFYSLAEAMLTVTVISISHLPKGLRGTCDSYVKVYLLPQCIKPQRTAARRKSLNPMFQEQFQFGRYGLEELKSFTLRFAVYMKFHSLKDSFVGEVVFPCAQATWSPESSSSYSRELSTTKTKLKKCLSSHDMSCSVLSSQPKSLGQLFLLLQYQALANRIKVLVRKAENLGRLTRMPGTPDHYVVIHLYHNGQVIDTKETKSIAGYNPVWNTPFLFNIPAGDIQQQELSLEFTVMQARIYTRSYTLGRVQVGPSAPEAGLVHWKEMCGRGQVESARWHLIQPEALRPFP
ncbi:synaptotagmin-5-like [Struthio camelus]|uniref:synaptotagmin-5-like n=1 Tax=Struthio camelus TaxID=8801 RepID=UPI003603F416